MAHSVFLLAAGFGTRLRPLTNHRPKPLLPLLGRPMLDYSLQWLKEHGHRSFIVNAHHLWQHVAEWAAEQDIEIQVELPEILGTGGGLKAAESKMADRFVIWNGDIIADIDVNSLLENCPIDGASMALRYKADLGKTTQLLAASNGQVQRIGSICQSVNAPEFPSEKGGIHFSGIHAMSKRAVQQIPEGFQCVVRTAYKELVPANKVYSIQHSGTWFDTGLPHEYLQANLQALRGDLPLSLDVWSEADRSFSGSWVHNEANVSGTVHSSVIGAQSVVKANTVLNSCVVWDGVTVPEGEFSHCIFHDGGCLQVDIP